MDISLVLREIVETLPISPMPTLIMWLPWRLLVLVFTDSDQNFWCKLYQIQNLWSKLVSDGDLEILLDNSDDVNKNELVIYVVTHTLWKFTEDSVAKLKLGLALDKPWQNRTRFHLNRH